MTTPTILPRRNEDYGFFGTMTRCPECDRRSAEVWNLASRLIAEAIRADSEDEMIGIRDFLDSRWGRHFADDVVDTLQSDTSDSAAAITATIAKWQDWRISRRTQREEGIPAGLSYLTGWVQHFAVTAAMEDTN
jgi:hypothetical protein